MSKDKKRILITLCCESCGLTTENDPAFVVTNAGRVYHNSCYESHMGKIWNDLAPTPKRWSD